MRCGARKCGEFNMLVCIAEAGHKDDHCYTVDHENDFPHNKRKPSRVTVKRVDAALQKAGIDAKLARGRGYWYFHGPDVEMAGTTSVSVMYLYQLTVPQWVLEAQRVKAAALERANTLERPLTDEERLAL